MRTVMFRFPPEHALKRSLEHVLSYMRLILHGNLSSSVSVIAAASMVQASISLMKPFYQSNNKVAHIMASAILLQHGLIPLGFPDKKSRAQALRECREEASYAPLFAYNIKQYALLDIVAQKMLNPHKI